MPTPTSSPDTKSLADIVMWVSVGVALLGAPAMLIKAGIRKSKMSLDDIFIGASAASAIPVGFILIFAAFKPQIIPQLRGLNVHIAAAGMALLFISVKKLID